jgi:hypothetical protein
LYYELRLWKVLGDPTVNSGFNQQGIFRARYIMKLDAAVTDSALTANKNAVIK